MSSGQESKTKLKVVKTDAKKTTGPNTKNDKESEKVPQKPVTDKAEERKKKTSLLAKAKRQQEESDESEPETDAMQNLLKMSQFETPAKKKDRTKTTKG